MVYKRTMRVILFGVLFTSLPFVLAIVNPTTPTRAISRSKYTRVHSLGENYNFNPRDGWQTFNATNLPYKYRNTLAKRGDSKKGERGKDASKSNTSKFSFSGAIGRVGGAIGSVWDGLKGIGNPEAVTITWYTGHDLENPSCWANGKWAPTDESFACAVTLQGWNGRPQCFKFLELCHTSKKCVFVRVVDTCAGCAKGSRHVDLTRAAFRQLADLSEGTLSVQLRAATEPTEWYEGLWGPKS